MVWYNVYCFITFCEILIIIWEVFLKHLTRLRFSVFYYFIQCIYDSIESKKKMYYIWASSEYSDFQRKAKNIGFSCQKTEDQILVSTHLLAVNHKQMT